jgi:TonB family protein
VRAVPDAQWASARHLLQLLLAFAVAAAGMLVPPSANAQRDEEQVRACVAELSRLITERFMPADFPADLLAAGVEGVTAMQLTVARDGTVSAWTIAQPSGNAALDDTARRLVSRLFPPSSRAPDDCRVGTELTVTLPLRFSLREAGSSR